VVPVNSGIKIGGNIFKIFGIKIVPHQDASIYINRRIFRGQIDIIRERNMRLLVVNHVNVEDYLKGVLYHEISHKWPIEAIKAQAVASRTFALYKAKINAKRDYDLTSDMYSQMYGGRTSEKYRTSRGVDATRGEILTYKDKLFPAYFHATCAGHTEDVSVLWNEDLVPLKGVKCDFCKKSKHYHWSRRLDLGDMEDTLRKNGYDIDNIKDIIILTRDRSGRILDINIKGQRVNAIISAKDFRQIFGPKLIRSTNFTVRVSGNSAYFNGFGWGHGVGMCQWGAYFMARQGYGYKEILQYYYPGAKIAKVSTF
jgi:stage II sporulation protein D